MFTQENMNQVNKASTRARARARALAPAPAPDLYFLLLYITQGPRAFTIWYNIQIVALAFRVNHRKSNLNINVTYFIINYTFDRYITCI